MLQLLHIENIAVIERADIELDKGLTVLSGETGAGKSIAHPRIGAGSVHFRLFHRLVFRGYERTHNRRNSGGEG